MNGSTATAARVLLDEALADQLARDCPGVILEVVAPRLDFTYSGACGLFDRATARPLQTTDRFRAASVTKAFTAATAVSLAATNQWNLEDCITDYLPLRVREILSRLTGPGDSKITLRQLLNHTSGLPDYFFNENFQARVRAQPERSWQPHELVAAASQSGSLLFPPGTDFSYGDTAYVLVGIAIEQILQCGLGDAYRSVILDPLAMNSTFLERDVPQAGSNLAHHYDGDRDLRYRNLSFDWAGGGLVTTAADLSGFLRGLFDGVLFEQRWLREMTHWRTATRWRPHSSARYLGYGLGLGRNIAYGEDIIGVTGVWGAFAYHWPDGDATITGTLNRVGADRPALMDAVIRALIPMRRQI